MLLPWIAGHVQQIWRSSAPSRFALATHMWGPMLCLDVGPRRRTAFPTGADRTVNASISSSVVWQSRGWAPGGQGPVLHRYAQVFHRAYPQAGDIPSDDDGLWVTAVGTRIQRVRGGRLSTEMNLSTGGARFYTAQDRRYLNRVKASSPTPPRTTIPMMYQSTEVPSAPSTSSVARDSTASARALSTCA